MAYTPKTWVCGETITADGLNNIEEGVQEALDCCGSGSAGYECTEAKLTVFDGSITTIDDDGDIYAEFTPSHPIDSDSIVVTFNGVKYEIPRIEYFGIPIYGEIDNGMPVFTTYPCVIFYDNTYSISTEQAGTYQVKIETLNVTIDSISSCFREAVNKCGGNFVITATAERGIPSQQSSGGWLVVDADYSNVTLDKNYNDIIEAFTDKKRCVIVLNGNTVIPLIKYDVTGFGTGSKHVFASAYIIPTIDLQSGTLYHGIATIQVLVDEYGASIHETQMTPLFT